MDAGQVGATEQGRVRVQRLQDLSSSVLGAVKTLLHRFLGGQDAVLGDPGKAAPVRFEGERRLAALRTDRVEALEAAFWRRHGGWQCVQRSRVRDDLGGGPDDSRSEVTANNSYRRLSCWAPAEA